MYTKKSHKEKKNEKKWNEQGTCTAKKKNHIEKFETQNLRKDIAAVVLVEDTEVTNKEECKT